MRILLRIIFMFTGFSASISNLTYFQTGSTFIYEVKGIIIDSKTAIPVISASIFIEGSSVGTVANLEGEFLLKIPHIYMNETLVISSIGYENMKVGISYFSQDNHLIELKAVPILLNEVTIVNQDARYLITSAIEKIRDNYSVHPLMVTTFYRESIKKGRKYVAVSEAVLEGYKASYASIFDIDRVSILKARKSSDFRNRDTIILKLQGGPLPGSKTPILSRTKTSSWNR